MALSRKILQYSSDGKFIKEFDSILQASRLLDISDSNIGKCVNGKYKTVKGFIFKEHTDGYSHEINKVDKPTRVIIQMDKDGEFIREFNSVVEASKSVDCAGSTISKCCRGKQKSAKGYTWKYK